MKSTASEIINLFRTNVNGTSMITVDLDSPMDGKMRKTNNPFVDKGIVKRETLNGVIGYIYANSVNRLAGKEGKDEREVKSHPWGDMDEKHLFRIHRGNGKHYLSMQVKNVTVHGFFTPDGTQIPDAEIRVFIPERKKSSTQADLEGEIKVCDYGMENITRIRAFGNEYELTEMPEAKKDVVEEKEVVTV